MCFILTRKYPLRSVQREFPIRIFLPTLRWNGRGFPYYQASCALPASFAAVNHLAAYRWRSSGPGEWSCVLRGRILSLWQDPTHLYYRTIFPLSPIKRESNTLDSIELIRDYFNLSVDLAGLYEKWSSRDSHFKKTAPKFAGIRMLRQDPWENLISFICSSNNNIARISQMVENLCIHFGPEIGHLNDITYYGFPIPSALTPAGVEEKLRALGFGYRAKYIHQTARMIVNDHPVDWLEGLRNVEYKDAHEALLGLQGVGPKVADCVCLMSLDKAEAVPVDTHVWQIAMRDYKFGKGKHKSLTKATYAAIGDHFRELWGNEAGWAHSVLFTADLKAFADKEAEVEKSATTTTAATTVKKEKKPKIKAEYKDTVKQKIGFTTARMRGERRSKTEAKDEGDDDGEDGEDGVKEKVEEEEEEVVNTTVKAEKREKRERRVKTEAGEKGYEENREVGVKPVIMVKRGRREKVGVKSEDEAKDKTGIRVELGDVTKEILVKDKRGLKRSLEIGAGVDIKLEDSSMTMADRIKIRRRR